MSKFVVAFCLLALLAVASARGGKPGGDRPGNDRTSEEEETNAKCVSDVTFYVKIGRKTEKRTCKPEAAATVVKRKAESSVELLTDDCNACCIVYAFSNGDEADSIVGFVSDGKCVCCSGDDRGNDRGNKGHKGHKGGYGKGRGY